MKHNSSSFVCRFSKFCGNSLLLSQSVNGWELMQSYFENLDVHTCTKKYTSEMVIVMKWFFFSTYSFIIHAAPSAPSCCSSCRASHLVHLLFPPSPPLHQILQKTETSHPCGFILTSALFHFQFPFALLGCNLVFVYFFCPRKSCLNIDRDGKSELATRLELRGSRMAAFLRRFH